ncbi:DsbA family protein [Roseitranquillus sediminis]|uniref:DsbA family protein n=1 Tax=Roseitranquillus sediminis TaxID=2809051 RepID=UPI001D0C8B3D|nr:DsbA family protein [Roseitranquillus sediminis]MBM9593464.1 DsbA family protein [Roseitranquillus sediminis]
MTRVPAILAVFVAFFWAMAAALPAVAQDASQVNEMTLGDADAPVTVVEYASFTCPHCRTFHQENFERLKDDFIDTGKIRFVYREVYFDRPGLWAGMVARCGGAERYFGIVDLLYQNQDEWARSEDPAQIAADLARIGRTAGLDDETIGACLQDGELAQALVAEYQRNAEADGIRSTPSFVIEGETYTNMPYAEMSEIIESHIDG